MSAKRKNTTIETGPAAKVQAVAAAGDASGSASPVSVVSCSPAKADAAKVAALQPVAVAKGRKKRAFLHSSARYCI